MNTKNDILRLEQEFKDCQKALIAIGDETRQLKCYTNVVTEVANKI